MSFVTHLLTPLLVTFIFVLTRVSGLVMTAPIFGTNDIPVRVRAFLAIALALLVTPLQIEHSPVDACVRRRSRACDGGRIDRGPSPGPGHHAAV